MRRKYLKGLDVVNWLRNDSLVYNIASLVWRNLLTALPVIKQWLTWEVGSGQIILLGLDPFVGGGSFYKLSDNLVSSLNSYGIYTLAQIKNEAYGSKWITGQELHLSGKEDSDWSCFMTVLDQNAISLSNKPYRLVCSWNKKHGKVNG